MQEAMLDVKIHVTRPYKRAVAGCTDSGSYVRNPKINNYL
jgi:hypothetical protein